MNALIGFFLNAFGPHVNAGWDIGWVFNYEGLGTWPHENFTTEQFEYHNIWKPSHNLLKCLYKIYI